MQKLSLKALLWEMLEYVDELPLFCLELSGSFKAIELMIRQIR